MIEKKITNGAAYSIANLAPMEYPMRSNDSSKETSATAWIWPTMASKV